MLQVRAKPTFENKNESTELINEFKGIFKENITDLQAKILLNAANGNINIIKEKYEISKVTSDIKNIMGWMLKAINKDYQIFKGKASDYNFNNYPQRPFDTTLEAKLLGWSRNEIDDDTGE